MPRRARLHVPGGLYYVVLRANPGLQVFSDLTDYQSFEALLATVLARCRASLYAFCFRTHAIHLVIRIADVPVGRIVQRLASQHARQVHRKAGGRGHLFEQRYRAILIDPDAYLMRLVRHVHWIPVREGAVADPADYRFSSHRAYLGGATVPWLTTRAILHALRRCAGRPENAYRDFMSRPADSRDVALFEHGSRRDPRVLGDVKPAPRPPRATRSSHEPLSLDRIIERVVQRLGVEHEALLSKSRRRSLSLARALITWHATELGVATLAAVGRRLRRDPSTLCVAVERYRVLRPDLFSPLALRDPASRSRR